MKRTFFILIISLLYSALLVAQPKISYIQPDIGTAGINTYIEIIAPVTFTGAYGNDSFYDNNPGSSVKVELVNINDTSKVVIGPLVVSWNGRLLSTHIFVKEHVKPTKEYWNDLPNEFRIPFKVVVNGVSSNVDTFYIVKPYHFGDLSSNAERILGQGTLGKRSKRGAILIDSAFFGPSSGGFYTIDKTDCDPITAGNQGYLPFVLLSVGKIEGSTTGISANGEVAQNGHGGNGGPGGGGGGGRFVDQFSGNDGDNAGSGFVSGGKGGYNDRMGSGAYKNYGDGTGPNGTSINGIDVPPIPYSWEASGGATGHPFGKCGIGCGNNNNWNDPGGYGGGSGSSGDKSGGSGGYATEGSSSYNGSISGGKIHGNIMCVPIAGGSGGASGNPLAGGLGSEYAGSGGGGGGAIVVFGKDIKNIDVSANGGNGLSGDDGNDGGNGSGGYVALQSKLNLYNVNARVPPGARNGRSGGVGRTRFEALSIVGWNVPETSTKYTGPSTDTTHWVRRVDTLVGSRDPNRVISFYLKPESGVWRAMPNVQYTGSTWKLPVEFKEKDTVWYFIAMQDVGSPSSTEYLYEPDYVLSQAAANILRLDKLPHIKGDSVLAGTVIGCADSVVYDTAYIKNIGEANLILDMAASYFKDGKPGFALFSPTGTTTITPGDSVKVILKYTYQPGQQGIVQDTFLLQHNDKFNGEKNPWKIAFSVGILTLKLEEWDIGLTREIDTLYLGKTCINEELTAKFNIKNVSEIPVTLKEPIFSISGYSVTLPADLLMQINDARELTISFKSATPNRYVGKMYIYIEECPSFYDSLYIVADIVAPIVKLYENNVEIIDTIDIGKVCIRDGKSVIVAVKNESEINVKYIDNQWTERAFFNIETLSDDVEIIPQDTSTVRISFNPLEEKMYYSELTLKFSNCGSFEKKYIIKGEGVNSDLQFTGTGVFPDTRVGKRTQTTVTLKNNGTQSAYIKDYPTLIPPFSVVSAAPPIPKELAPGEEIVFTVEFAPTSEGQQATTLTVFSVLQPNACPDTANIVLSGLATQSQLSVSSNIIDFGLLASCLTKSDSVKLRNRGNSEANITNAYIMGGASSYFSIIKQPLPLPFVLASQSEQTYVVLFNPNNTATGIKNDTLVIETDDPDDSIFKVALVGRNESLTVNYPTTVDLGAYPIGKSKSMEIVVTNRGELDVHISGVNIIPSGTVISVVPTSANIPGNNGTAVFTVTLDYNQAGQLSADFEFIFDSPCAEKIAVHITGEGLEAKFDITETINYGIVAPCEEKLDSIRIQNTGLTDFEITKKPEIVGADKDLFVVENTEPFPHTIKPGEIFYIKVMFVPVSSTDGVKQADLVVNFQFSNAIADVRVGLRGERQTGLLAVPNPIEFGSIVAGDNRQRTVVLTNVGAIPLTIEEILPNTLPDVFKTIPSNLNITLNPGDNVEIIILFTPTLVQKYIDTIPFRIKYQTCESIEILIVKGEASPADIITLKIDSIFTTPDKRNFRIPVYALIKDKSKTVEMNSFTGELSFDATMFLPEALSKGDIIENTVTKDQNTKQYTRTIKFKIAPLVISSQDSILTEIIGSTLLGNSDTTSFIWNLTEYEWEPGLKISTTIFNNGFLNLLICEEGGKRLITQTSGGLKLFVAPNPGNDEINITGTCGETGKHIINLNTVQGNVNKLFEWTANSVDEAINFKLNMKNYSSGLYYITIYSPTETKSAVLMLVK